MADTSQNPIDIHRIPNCDTLTLYRIERSRFWQYRFRKSKGGGYKRGSTQLEDFRQATAHARQIWMEQWQPKTSTVPTNRRVDHFVDLLIAQEKKLVEQKQRNARFLGADEPRLKVVKSFFEGKAIDTINGQSILEFQNHLYERNTTMSRGTLRHYLVVLRKVLKTAAITGAIQYLPQFPKAGAPQGVNSRTGFTLDEYNVLAKHLKEKAATDSSYDEIKDVVDFLISSALRPSELKLLTSRNVREAKDEGGLTLYVLPPNPKVAAYNYETFTLSPAVTAFRRMKERNPNPDDYLFFNTYKDRNYALRLLGEVFGAILVDTGLKYNQFGKRTLYSLRHSGISWMLQYMSGSVFDVARWARTSVEMIEKHYASVYSLLDSAAKIRTPNDHFKMRFLQNEES